LDELKSIEDLDFVLRLVHPEWTKLLVDWVEARDAASKLSIFNENRWWFENVTNLAKYSDNPTVKEALQVCLRANLFIL